MHIAQSLQQGAEYLLIHDYQKAADYFNDVRKHDPNNVLALLGIASIFFEMGHFRQAWDYTQKALYNEPRKADVLSFASQIALQVGMFEDAYRYSKQACKLAPKSAYCISKFLYASQRIQDTPNIPKLVQQLLSQDKNPKSYLAAGSALESISKVSEAIRMFRNGIRKALQKNAPPPKPQSPPIELEETLLEIKKIFDSLRIPFCLGHGTLLGIYRDGKMLPGDSDIDIMLPWNIDRQWLAEELKRFGCIMTISPQHLQSIEGQWCFSIMAPPNDRAVEISFLKPENGKVWFGFVRGNNIIKLPVSPFKFSSVRYLGVDFPIPHPCDKHLSEIYGETWNKRTRNRNFFIIHPNIVDTGHIRISYTLDHILAGLISGDYKKAQGYTEQLLSVYDDPLLLQLREYFTNLPFEITLFDPLPWQENRISYKQFVD